nr:ATP-binding cassette domain-containing protein [uncultured Anaerobutyricum sp.]
MALSVHIKKKLKDFELAVDFDMDEGIVGFLGSSGCGKSMTLKCIAGIETPDDGRIVLDDEVLFDKEQGINLSPQKRKVGYLFQNYALFPHMTVRQNIEAGLAASGKSKQEKKEIVERLLEQFHIKELENSYPIRISGGQQQRAALARMMAAEPKFLLLDEPFSALDAYLKEKLMQEMMTYLNQFKKGVIMVSHSRDEVYQMCSDTVIMHRGILETVGKTRDIFDNPGTVNAARLTGCKNISYAIKTGTHEVYASDWDVKLTFPEQTEIPSNLTHVGIRAHEIRPIVSKDADLKDMDLNESIKLNTMKCQLERISEAPFEMYLILQNKSGKSTSPLWWKVTKKEWQEIGEKVPETVELPVEHIILLK